MRLTEAQVKEYLEFVERGVLYPLRSYPGSVGKDDLCADWLEMHAELSVQKPTELTGQDLDALAVNSPLYAAIHVENAALRRVADAARVAWNRGSWHNDYAMGYCAYVALKAALDALDRGVR